VRVLLHRRLPVEPLRQRLVLGAAAAAQIVATELLATPSLLQPALYAGVPPIPLLANAPRAAVVK
jgi:hypothetical protein